MATESGPTAKECVFCGRDCTGRPRLKDSKGRYYCKECYEKAKAKKKAAASAGPPAKGGKKASGSAPKGAKTATKSKAPPPARSEAEPVSAGDDDGLGMLADAVSGTDAAPVVSDSRQSCPGCGKPMAAGVVVCMSCGFNRQSGQRVATRVDRPVVRGSGAFGGGGWELPAVLYQPWIAGAVPIFVFGVLFCLAWNMRTTVGVYLAVVCVFGLVVGVLVLISAFRKGIGTGLLCLCLPFFVLYYVYFKMDSARLVYAYTVGLAAIIAFFFLPGVLDSNNS